MLRCSLVVAIILNTLLLSAQKEKFREISVSQLFIWNKTTVNDVYGGARASDKTGNAWSNGSSIHFSFGLNQKLYASLGVGLFNQQFGIQRGFDFYEPNNVTGLFYSTKKYGYKSVHYSGSIGYRKKAGARLAKSFLKKTEARLSATYNLYQTYRQEFTHDFGSNFLGNPNPQIRKANYRYGTSVALNAGLVNPVFKSLSMGVQLVVPVYNRWKKDAIFRDAANEYHGADFSSGACIQLIYNLNR
ncbi:MAG: hypothetical protein JNM68_07720 [Dinghuibacter sp.]|nr:hypothetical protein [Dinghuibacter sp.]